MSKIAITITPEMDKALRRQSGKTGAPVAEIARRAIAHELRRMGEKVAWDVAWGGPREENAER
jgi:predicted DNA-binding protein